MSTPSSPPARRLDRPRWLDPRLVAGVVLVLVSVAAGARLLSDAEQGDLVWSTVRDLSAGTTLEPADVEAVSVRLAGATGSYIDASAEPPTGYLLLRDLSAGELLPAAAVSTGATRGSHRLVSVPVAVHHFPAGLARGQRVDVYVTAAAAAGATPDDGGEPRLVLAGATVSQVSDTSGAFGSGSGIGVVLEVESDDAAAVVGAVASGAIQLVLLPAGS